MRRTRRAWLIGIGATAALLVAVAAIAAFTTPRWLDQLASQEDAATIAGDGGVDVGAPEGVMLPGLEAQKEADLGLDLRSDADETLVEPGVENAPAALVLAADGRRLVRTAELGLVIDGHDVGAAADRVAVITAALGGYVLFSYTGSPADTAVAYPEDGTVLREDDVVVAARDHIGTATVTVRVPAGSFETALRRFGKLGEVEYQRTSAQDVSDQMVDLEARLRHARAVERRLLRFLEATDTIREMLAVQDRLDQVQLEIEQLTAQLEALREVVAFGTISVSLHAEGDPRPVIGAGGGLWDNFVDAWRLLGRSAGVLLMALAATLPFVIVFGGTAGAVWYGARRLGRRRSRDANAAGSA
ncbi:MAG: DUF4349 domain-containing protein [Thermoleophilia bacterium]|nr:DUF4349 domain-containing protein [Thermoleophilia bacterium]